jgi:hypothetical protein
MGVDCPRPGSEVWLRYVRSLDGSAPASAFTGLIRVQTTGAWWTPSRVAFEIENLGTALMRAQATQTPAMQQYIKLWRGGLPDGLDGWLRTGGSLSCTPGQQCP